MTAHVLEAPVEPPELFKGAGGMSPPPERLEGYKRILAAFLWRSHRTVSIAIARQPLNTFSYIKTPTDADKSMERRTKSCANSNQFFSLMVCLYIKDAYMIKQNRLKVV